MPKTRGKGNTSSPRKAYLIQGMFYQDKPAPGQDKPVPGVIFRSGESKIIVGRRTLFSVPFHGIIWEWSPSRHGSPEGVMWDAHGRAALCQTEISNELISFYQAYEHRSDYVGFRFRRKETNIWQGRWKGDECHGEGLAWCILTEVANMALTDPMHLAEILHK